MDGFIIIPYSGCCCGHQHRGDPVPAQEALGLHLPPLQGGQPRLLTWPPLLLQPHLVLGMAGEMGIIVFIGFHIFLRL